MPPVRRIVTLVDTEKFFGTAIGELDGRRRENQGEDRRFRFAKKKARILKIDSEIETKMKSLESMIKIRNALLKSNKVYATVETELAGVVSKLRNRGQPPEEIAGLEKAKKDLEKKRLRIEAGIRTNDMNQPIIRRRQIDELHSELMQLRHQKVSLVRELIRTYGLENLPGAGKILKE